MVKLNAAEQAFVEQRDRLARRWPVVGIVLMAAVFGTGVWLWTETPFLINPWAVVDGLRSDSIPPSTLALTAGMLPLVTLGCLLVLLLIPILAFAAFTTELKLIAIIERLTAEGHEHGDAGAP